MTEPVKTGNSTGLPDISLPDQQGPLAQYLQKAGNNKSTSALDALKNLPLDDIRCVNIGEGDKLCVDYKKGPFVQAKFRI